MDIEGVRSHHDYLLVSGKSIAVNTCTFAVSVIMHCSMVIAFSQKQPQYEATGHEWWLISKNKQFVLMEMTTG